MFETIATSIHRVTIRARTAAVLASFAILTVISTSGASGQATYTADRTNGFSVFGGVSKLDTDYGVTDNGFMFGGDFSHSIRFRRILPSIEARYTGSTGTGITEKSFMGGLKLETKIYRFHPYANALIGYGEITVVPLKYTDNSVAYGFGVGADINVTRSFALKVDAQEEFWKLGQATSALTPRMATVGILYRLPSSFRRNR